MPEGLQHFVQFTDKWSKRRFALKLRSPDDFTTIQSLIDYLKNLSDPDLKSLIQDEFISEQGAAGLEDIRCIVFHIDTDGSIGDILSNIKIKQHGRSLTMGDQLKFGHRATEREGYSDVYVADLIVDRDDVQFDRNWKGFYSRKWNRNPHFKEFVESVVHKKYSGKADTILKLGTYNDTHDFLSAVAEELYKAPYELYSRFIDRKLRYKTGPETLDCVMSGRGGNCSEKAAAFEFIAVNYGLESKIVLGGDDAKGEFPHRSLRRALDEFDFRFKDEAQKYWDHFANLFIVDGVRILIDATGGPIPYLFAEGDEAKQYLNQEKCSPLWFLAEQENYYYHEVDDDLTHDTMFSLEAFVPDVDLYHVLGPDDGESPFGLLVTKNLWVCPTVYKTDAEYVDYKKAWEEWAMSAGRKVDLEVYPNLDASPDKKQLTRLEKTDPALVADLRTAEDNFVERCRKSWKDPNWKSGFVFAEFASE